MKRGSRAVTHAFMEPMTAGAGDRAGAESSLGSWSTQRSRETDRAQRSTSQAATNATEGPPTSQRGVWDVLE